MYRITAMLTDEQVTDIARAGCGKRFCLKQRLWTVKGLGSDEPSAKSLIPCLEPCAVLLELARVVARIEQGEKHNVPLTQDELATIAAALKQWTEIPCTDTRAADFSAPDNRLRAQWVYEKLKPLLAHNEDYEDE
jgi:hypothetical protein